MVCLMIFKMSLNEIEQEMKVEVDQVEKQGGLIILIHPMILYWYQEEFQQFKDCCILR